MLKYIYIIILVCVLGVPVVKAAKNNQNKKLSDSERAAGWAKIVSSYRKHSGKNYMTELTPVSSLFTKIKKQYPDMFDITFNDFLIFSKDYSKKDWKLIKKILSENAVWDDSSYYNIKKLAYSLCFFSYFKRPTVDKLRLLSNSYFYYLGRNYINMKYGNLVLVSTNQGTNLIVNTLKAKAFFIMSVAIKNVNLTGKKQQDAFDVTPITSLHFFMTKFSPNNIAIANFIADYPFLYLINNKSWLEYASPENFKLYETQIVPKIAKDRYKKNLLRIKK